MTVREYIGARYVPLFMGEWSDENAYEPLSIVVNQGNSYTSRQSVPIGIPISNTSYWALTGNYNAQVEQYREEVATLVEEVGDLLDLGAVLPATDFSENNTVKKYIDDSNGKTYVGAYGAIEDVDTNDWSDIIGQIAEAGYDTVNFGNGHWIVNEQINFPATIKNVIANGAIIETTQTVATLFKLLTADLEFGCVRGLTFKCKGNVGTVLTTDSYNVLQVFNCSFYNFTQYGIYNNGLGAFVSDCLFNNDEVQSNSVGVYTKTDSFVINCKFFYMLTCIKIGGNSNVSNCYFWGYSHDASKPLTAIESYSGTKEKCLIVTNCQFDCVVYCIKEFAEVIVTNNVFYWNGVDDTLGIDHGIFVFDASSIATNLVFNDNVLGCATNKTVGKIYTFLRLRDGQITGQYTSRGNISNVPSEVYSMFALTCGFAPNFDTPIPNPTTRWTKFVPALRNATFQWPGDVQLTLQPYDAKMIKKGSNVKFFQYPNLLSGRRYVYTINDGNSPFFISNEMSQITEYLQGGNVLYNMDWTPQTSEPDTTQYTKTACAIIES